MYLRMLIRLCGALGALALALTLALAQPPPAIQAESAAALVRAARAQVGVTTGYDPAYVRLAYPGGDVALQTGVCTDVIVRAYRQLGRDLQRAVHEDMRGNFAHYPQRWGLEGPDRNIDHRRVPNLMTYFHRQGAARPVGTEAGAYRPGDVVAWNLGGGQLHIGIVSDRKSARGTPLILHNIGRGTQEEDILFAYKIIGHYRYLPAPAG
ncbi:MAG: DUF1287 domain-containing protein [Verrucomicrobiota bacterium]